ncbi:28767_t:CDS:2, partial [Gigaspora margarita]
MASITPITEDQFAVVYNICVPLFTISLISSIASCVTFGFIRLYYPKLADRVTFRLSFAALFSDIGFSGHYLGLFLWSTPGLLCGYLAWASVFFTLASVFFTVCIAMNLHIIFINEYRGRYKFEKYYFTFAFSLALLLSLLPINDNMYGFDDTESGCWYRDSGQEYNIIWQWATLFGWVHASILYCAIVIIMVIQKLKNLSEKVDEFDSSTSGFPTLINKTVISSIVRRIVWYPMVPLASQFFSSSVETHAYFDHAISYPLFILCFVGTSLQGLLNALVFSQDIAVIRAFQAIKLQWWTSNVNSYESQYPHRSYNKAITDEFSISENFIELKTLNRNKADIIINNDIVDDDINDDINRNIVLEPSFLEWLRYMLLIKLFSPPKSSPQLSQLISTKCLSPINSSAGNKPNTSSSMFGKNDSKQDITLDNQNGDQVDDLVLPEQPIHLKDSVKDSSSELSSYCLNPPISSDHLIGSSSSNQANISIINNTNLINTSNCTVGGDEGLIDVIFANGEQTKKGSEEFTKIF